MSAPQRTVRWLLVIILAFLFSGVAVALAVPDQLAVLTGQAGTGYDPLTSQEQLRAVAAIGLTPPQQQAPAMDFGTLASPAVLQRPVRELILVQRHEETKATYAQGRWPRRADIYVYQYTDDMLIHTVFNLDANRIESMESARGVQPALTAAEVQRATAVLFVDAAVRSQVEREFEQITGQPLVSPAQLTVKAFVFHADALPGHNLGDAAALCGAQRCAQLLITAGDNVALQSVPVINLSAGVVAYLSRLDGGAQ